MLVCGLKKGFFCVYTNKDFCCISISYEENLVSEHIIPRAKLYVLEVVLPEILTKHWTKIVPEQNVPVDDNEMVNIEVHATSNEPTDSTTDQTSQIAHSVNINDEPTNTILPTIVSDIRNPLSEVTTTMTITAFQMCFCNGLNEIPRNNSGTVNCANSSCRAKVFHRFCLESLGKKRFSSKWICDPCKHQKNSQNQGKKRQKQDPPKENKRTKNNSNVSRPTQRNPLRDKNN